MSEVALEETMLDFVDGRYDVLASTAIIESGLDIPRANTMVIDRADLFGLAQLYQLRPRWPNDMRVTDLYRLMD